MEPTTSDMIIQFIPLTIIQIFYAWVVYLIAGKRGKSPWGWTIGTVVPVVGMFVAGIFMLMSFLSVLDRLNVLEAKAGSA